VSRRLLLDGDCRRQSFDRVDIRLFHETEELSSVCGKRFYVATLPFGVDGIECKRALPGAGQACDDRELVPRYDDIDVAEVVLARTSDNESFFCHIQGKVRVGPGTDKRAGSALRLGSPMPHTDAIVVLTTVASEEEALHLVRALLERRLIACGTLLPQARSLYRWQGKIAEEKEVVVMLKTRSARMESLTSAFGELHPYKVPELLAVPVAAGLEKYLEWINSETSLALA